MVHEAKEFIDILEGEIIKEDIDELFMEMAYNQELRYNFIMFLRITYAIKGYDTTDGFELTETTNKIFYKLGFEIPGIGKVKKGKGFLSILKKSPFPNYNLK